MHPTAVCTSWAWRRSTLDQHGSIVPALLSADLPSRVVYAAAAKVLTSHRAPPTTCTRVRTICSSSVWSRSRIEYGWHACTLPRTRQSGRSNPSSGQYSFWPFGQTPNNNMVPADIRWRGCGLRRRVMETSCTRYRHIYVCTHRSHQQYKSISTSSEKKYIIHYSYMMIQNRLRWRAILVISLWAIKNQIREVWIG